MGYFISVYARALKSKNFSGPKDPTAHIFRLPDNSPYPTRLIESGAVRYFITDTGEIIYAIPGVNSVKDGNILHPKAFSAAENFSVNSTINDLEKDLR